jgi:hypothetical protein
METAKEGLLSNEKHIRTTQGEAAQNDALCDDHNQPAVVPRRPDYVRLDVGGTRYTTLLSTLCKHPDSMLARMFRGNSGAVLSAIPVERDDEGAYVIDRDGPSFRHVLNYLRHEGPGTSLPPLDDAERSLLAAEADYFCLPELARECILPPKLRSIPQDLSDADLTNRNFKGLDLTNCNLSNSDLSGADLRECNLCGANLSNAKLERTLLQGARMERTSLEGATGTPGDMGAVLDKDHFCAGARVLVERDLADFVLSVATFDHWADPGRRSFAAHIDCSDGRTETCHAVDLDKVVLLAGCKIVRGYGY